MPKNKPYTLKIDMNALNHLGLGLYSNNAAVISEVVANAWDADATKVRIDYSEQNDKGTITVLDNGCGMDSGDIQEKYLLVGYQKREVDGNKTALGRKPMGRKGIGKLSIFSIAEKIFVYTKKKGKDGEAFELDARDIKEHIAKKSQEPYAVKSLPFGNEIQERGTVIKITELKRGFNRNTYNGLKKRIARRFSIIGAEYDFIVSLDGEEIIYSDRDYFHKAEFLFQYRDDYSKYCKNLDGEDPREESVFDRSYRFNQEGNPDEKGEYAISGWIAIARHSNDLDSDSGAEDDNLNKITLVVRGKVAKDDILAKHRMGSIITKFIYGEIHADFLDMEDDEDIATSNRQEIIEEDPRFVALTNFIKRELKKIRTETDKLKDKTGLRRAIKLSPRIKRWYDTLGHQSLKDEARKIFGFIAKSNVEESSKTELYVYGVMAFEQEKLNRVTGLVDKLDENNVEQMLSFFRYVDDIEAAHYREIVNKRLSVIRKLQAKMAENVKEIKLEEYLFDHLWLFDPAWEMATGKAEHQKTVQSVVDGEVRAEAKRQEKLKDTDGNVRKADIIVRYRMAQHQHVVIELKRHDRRVSSWEIGEQLDTYMKAVKMQLKKTDAGELPVVGVCLVGKIPTGWENPQTKEEGEKMLDGAKIRVMTYQQMVDNAYAAYSEFLEVQKETSELAEMVAEIRGKKEGGGK